MRSCSLQGRAVLDAARQFAATECSAVPGQAAQIVFDGKGEMTAVTQVWLKEDAQ